ncbi:hypothetical protein [Tenacibaculum maritimum]|uniref:Knr4/Smi1-like domain-containing protein n=1 Tax=Tenacibaculum maritimum NCIMB 2154 TaxID=1349785 RepID=A0A2H1E813_9FLAO|nr:hypothetical protein [Tenacibaculum maritimum]SFZ80524.1 conserved protein of unknown function [Tenacibaculum maritimum NCIMB 2154]
MELKYMQQLKDNPNLLVGVTLEGLGEDRILVLESKFNKGKKFPLSFREYLVLGGVKGGTGVVDNDFEELREDCEESLEYTGYKMDRPYFVFDRLDSQYSIFFLDEEKEDPDIYILDAFAKKEENWPLYRDVKYTFSKMINDAIYRRLNNIPL